MPKLNINNDLFLGVQELGRLQDSIGESGLMKFIRLASKSFGVVESALDTEFGSFEVEESSEENFIEVPENSNAIDSLGNMISVRDTPILLEVPTGGDWYWVKISYQESVLELGTVSLAEDGSLSGVGTEFSKTLRGQPDFPSRIALFVKDSDNNYTVLSIESEVVSVLSDTSAMIGIESFGVISDAKYAVIGTFTPGVPVPSGSEYPFRHDGCLAELVEEIAENTPPTKEDYEYYVARVKNEAGIITIQDKRFLNMWSLVDE